MIKIFEGYESLLLVRTSDQRFEVKPIQTFPVRAYQKNKANNHIFRRSVFTDFEECLKNCSHQISFILDSWNQWVIMLKMYFSLGGSDVRFARWGEENPSGIILTFNENFSDRNDSFLSNHLLMLMTSWCWDLNFWMLMKEFWSWWHRLNVGTRRLC